MAIARLQFKSKYRNHTIITPFSVFDRVHLDKTFLFSLFVGLMSVLVFLTLILKGSFILIPSVLTAAIISSALLAVASLLPSLIVFYKILELPDVKDKKSPWFLISYGLGLFAIGLTCLFTLTSFSLLLGLIVGGACFVIAAFITARGISLIPIKYTKRTAHGTIQRDIKSFFKMGRKKLKNVKLFSLFISLTAWSVFVALCFTLAGKISVGLLTPSLLAILTGLTISSALVAVAFLVPSLFAFYNVKHNVKLKDSSLIIDLWSWFLLSIGLGSLGIGFALLFTLMNVSILAAVIPFGSFMIVGLSLIIQFVIDVRNPKKVKADDTYVNDVEDPKKRTINIDNASNNKNRISQKYTVKASAINNTKHNVGSTISTTFEEKETTNFNDNNDDNEIKSSVSKE